MRRVPLTALALLSAFLALPACSSTRGPKVDTIEEEVATLTSLALANPGLTPLQRQRVTSAGAIVRSNLEDLR